MLPFQQRHSPKSSMTSEAVDRATLAGAAGLMDPSGSGNSIASLCLAGKLFASPLSGLVALCLLGICLSMPVEANASLIAHWTGDGNALDATGNGHNGTLVGDTTFSAGALGDGFLFDGVDDYVAIPNSPALEPSVLTVAAFVRMPDAGGSQRLIVDSSHGFVDLRGWALQTRPSGEIGFVLGTGSTFLETSSTTPIDDNQIHHIAGVLDGTSLSIYVDGNLEMSDLISGPLVPSGREIRIGASWGGVIGGSIRGVNGLIDDVRIYDHALTATEIQSLANAAAVPEPSAFVLLLMGFAGFILCGRKLRNKHDVAENAQCLG